MFRNHFNLHRELRKAKNNRELHDMLSAFSDIIDGKAKRYDRVIKALEKRFARDAAVLARKLADVKSVSITDYSQYVADKSYDGGCYSFTTEYYREDNNFIVSHSTSYGGFDYCSHYGFLCNDDCEERCPNREYDRVSAIQLANIILESEDSVEINGA